MMKIPQRELHKELSADSANLARGEQTPLTEAK
jgi:hypothetical protein